MSQREKIISEEEILRVHGNANFGSLTPRDVVDDGVFKYSIGFSGGSTQAHILREHGLITVLYNYKANLIVKGKKYARALYREGRIVFK